MRIREEYAEWLKSESKLRIARMHFLFGAGFATFLISLALGIGELLDIA